MRFAVLLALATTQVRQAGAEEQPLEPGLRKFEARHTREILPGVETAALSDVVTRRARPSWVALLDSGFEQGVARVRGVDRGPWSSAELTTILENPGLTPALILSALPSPLEPPWLDGFHFDGNRIDAWPPSGVLLRASPDGIYDLVDSPEEEAWLETEDGLKLELQSFNGPPGDGLALYSGELLPTSGAASWWPQGTQAVSLVPGALNAAPHRSVWDLSLPSDQRSWLPGGVRAADRLFLRSDEYAVIVPPGLSETVEVLSSSQSLTITVALDIGTRLSLFTTAVGEWYLKDGKDVSLRSFDESDVQSIVSVGAEGRKLGLFEFGTESSAFPAAPRDLIVERLLGAGAVSAAVLPSRGSRLHIGSLDRNRMTLMAERSVRRVLTIEPGRPELPGLGTAPGLSPIDLQFSAVSRGSSLLGSPEALVDDRARFDRRGEHFWSVDTGKEDPWVEFRLLEPAEIGAIDVIHASACGFSGHFNVPSFRVLGRASQTGGWKEMATVARDEPVDHERITIDFAPTVEWLRLEILEPAFQPGVQRARLCEIIVWGTPRGSTP